MEGGQFGVRSIMNILKKLRPFDYLIIVIIIFAVIVTSIFIHMLSVIKVGEAFDWSKFLV